MTAEPFAADHMGEADWVWIDCDDPNEHEAVADAIGFDLASVADLSDEAFPKTDLHEDFRHVVLNAMTFDDDRVDTVAYHALVTDRYLVTFRSVPIFGIERVREGLTGSHPLLVRTPMELLALMVISGSERFLPLIGSLENQIDGLEDRAMAADATVIGEAQALRRDAITLRRTFGPQRDLLASLSRDPAIEAPVRRTLNDAFDHTYRLVESLDALRSLLAGIQETHRGAIAERTNEVMKVLTVFSAIMLPLTLITGLWGMNVASLPGEATSDAFWWLIGVMAGVAIGLWLYFAWRGFVGGPKLGRLPKAVGITLAHLGTAPLRAVARPVEWLGDRISPGSDQNAEGTQED